MGVSLEVIKQEMLKSIDMAYEIKSLDNASKLDILNKYDIVAKALANKTSPEAITSQALIRDNKATFDNIFNPVVIDTLRWEKGADYASDLYLTSQALASLMSKKTDEIIKEAQSLGITPVDDVNAEGIGQALSLFGLPSVEKTGDTDDLEEVDDFNFNDIEGNNDDEFELDMSDFDTDEDAESDIEDDDEGIEFTDDDFNDEDESTASAEDNTTNADAETAKEDASTEETKKRILTIYKAQIDQSVNALVRVLSAIYESSFSAIPHAGILINNGNGAPLIKLKDTITEGTLNNMQTAPDEGTSFDYMIMQTICEEIPCLSKYQPISNKLNAIPDIEMLMNSDGVCHALHLQLQSANIQYCVGNTSIRKWITETKVKTGKYTSTEEWIQKANRGNTTKITSFKDVRDWYSWCLKNVIVDSLIKSGVKDLTDMETVEKVLEAIIRNVKNIIVVGERAVGEVEEIKVCTDKPIPADRIISKLQDKLNIGGTSSEIKIKQVANENFAKYNVLTLKIIFDQEKENKSDKFAYEIINRLAESGMMPSWDNALLGKKEDGTYLFWDGFTQGNQPFKRCYTIYAGSRSGKGVMTSTLIASAMCDGRHIFYTDGKPENGPCLGELAWREGKEAYVFDGQARGKRPFDGYMEKYAEPVRHIGEVAEYMNPESMPECLFANNNYFSTESQMVFLGVMRYLKSLQLCATIVGKRASGDLPCNDWQVWVFDEMTDMSNKERQIRGIFAKYLRDKTGAKELGTDDPKYYKLDFSKVKEDTNDAGIDYIKAWDKWVSSLPSLVTNLNTISMGKANMNIIFIFQEATWLQKDKDRTTIGHFAFNINTTKIVGKNALANACGPYGEGATQKTDWYTRIMESDQLWAISNASDIRSAHMTLFKPYKVWTTPLLPGSDDRDPNGDPNDQRYVGAYITKLLSMRGMNPADVLQESYDYAENAVQTLGYAGSVKEYLYNCANFSIGEVSASYTELLRAYNTSGQPIESSEFVSGQTIVPNEESFGEGYVPSDERAATGDGYRFAEERPYTASGEPLNSFGMTAPVHDRSDDVIEMARQSLLFDDEEDDTDDWGESTNSVDNGAGQVNYTNDNANVGTPELNVDMPAFDGTAQMLGAPAAMQFSQNGKNIDINSQALRTPPIKLDSTNFIDEPYKEESNGWLKLFGKSETGISYLFRRREDALIDGINHAIRDKNAVTRINIEGDMLVVNDRAVDTRKLINVEYGIRFEDFVKVSRLIAEYKNLQSLRLDHNAYVRMVDEYGNTAQDLWRVFQEAPALNEIIYFAVPCADKRILRRNEFQGVVRQLEADMARANFENNIQMRAAAVDPNVQEKGIGYTTAVTNTAKKLGSAAVNNLTKENPSLGYAVANGVFALPVAMLGGLLMAGTGIARFMRKLGK